ncbi:hypothetical protein GCM10007876_28440 [Litoribrevibacter albus]|uniref:Uncharacterized protein n=1 Tax=Litoribrevibacter albus TaxID=1473156 RepID=A0AA37W7A7_9GAMM|nr:hypothetical protein GCM10007876_28440 [Litoribrevibacter albus]
MCQNEIVQTKNEGSQKFKIIELKKVALNKVEPKIVVESFDSVNQPNDLRQESHTYDQ